MKVSGVSKGKGFAGTIKRHNFSARPRQPRLAQRAGPGLDRRLGRPRARVQGHPRPRPDGQQARHPARPRGRGRARRREPAAGARLGARPQGRRRRDPGGRPDGCAPRRPTSARRPARSTSTRPSSARTSTSALVHEAVRAELAARRRGTASTLTRGEIAMTGAKAWRQKGTGRARAGALSAPPAHRRRRDLRPQAARTTPSRSTARRAGARCARRCRCTPSATRSPLVDAAAFDAPSTKQAAEALEGFGRGPRAGGAGRRRGERRQVLSQPRAA